MGVVGGEQLGALVGECRDATTSGGLVLFGLDLFDAQFGLHCDKRWERRKQRRVDVD
ncbi:MAG: hypothetical protein ACRDSR_00865 [Pseudonocardiaceae bacterium]